MTNAKLDYIKNTYKKGTTVMLTSDMGDPYHPLHAGLKGKVQWVDDIGDIGVKWENGSSLSLIPGEDSFCIVD